MNPERAKTRHHEFPLSNTNLPRIPGVVAGTTGSPGIDDSSCRATVTEPSGTPWVDDRDWSVMVP